VLREVDAIVPRPAVVLGPLEQIVEDFQRHLSQERGLRPPPSFAICRLSAGSCEKHVAVECNVFRD
jgi:hypothetical protein